MKIYDRLYKEMKFPAIIMELLNCPGLLRLRDVRMANNQFVAFPAFATASRYEHSLGVCYLAGICADKLGLDEKSRIELMMACLYHDVGTPPFAHAMEEVLQAKFGFDHEKNLKDLILGTTGVFDGELAQVYQGQSLKLRSVCQNSQVRRLGIDLERIAMMAVGDSAELFSGLVNSRGMDLDNIDNIFRASSAMGIIQGEYGEMAKMLAGAFRIQDGEICLDGLYWNQIREWQHVRDIQYAAIFESEDDFAYQTMVKEAINLLFEEDENVKLDKQSWRMTDSEITNNVLLKHRKSRAIMQRVLLCQPYTCLGILYLKGDNSASYVNSHLREIEQTVGEYFVEFMGISKKRLQAIGTSPVVANFYLDKRKRAVLNKIISVKEETINKSAFMSGTLLGFFTPLSNENYKNVEERGIRRRKRVSFGRFQMEEVRGLLKKGLLKEFEVTFYGGKGENEKTDTNARADQLGLF